MVFNPKEDSKGIIMNINKSTKTLFLIVFSLSLWNCSSVLDDVEPSTSISFNAALSSPEGISAVRTSMYSKILGSFDMTTEYMIGPDAIADLTRNRPGSTRFNDLNQADGVTLGGSLGTFGVYEVIQDANLLIGAIEDGILDDATKAQYEGEALAIRAWAFHIMARSYAYEPGNESNGPESNWNQGIMLRVDPTLNITDAAPIARSTVAETYAQIISDLTEAETKLAGLNLGTSYVNEMFVKGLRARVELYAGNYSTAATYARDVIDNSGVSLVDTEAGIGEMFYQANPEAIFELVVNASTEQIAGGNTNSGLAAYTSVQWVAQIPTNVVIDSYDAGDYRLSGWFGACPTNGCSSINDEGLVITKWNGWKGNFVDDITYMRVAEMYLIEAEALAKSGNIPGGAAVLKTLRDARNAGAIPATATANVDAFEDFILEERIRELVGEGHRFYDLKRTGNFIPQTDGSPKMRADSFRMLAPYGTGYQNINPLVVENPGYPVAN